MYNNKIVKYTSINKYYEWGKFYNNWVSFTIIKFADYSKGIIECQIEKVMFFTIKYLHKFIAKLINKKRRLLNN